MIFKPSFKAEFKYVFLNKKFYKSVVFLIDCLFWSFLKIIIVLKTFLVNSLKHFLILFNLKTKSFYGKYLIDELINNNYL